MLLKRRLFAAEKRLLPHKGHVSIAFLDTGISPVADFIQPENRIVCFLDLVNGKTAPYDDNGHGTHVTDSFLENAPKTYFPTFNIKKQHDFHHAVFAVWTNPFIFL